MAFWNGEKEVTKIWGKTSQAYFYSWHYNLRPRCNQWRDGDSATVGGEGWGCSCLLAALPLLVPLAEGQHSTDRNPQAISEGTLSDWANTPQPRSLLWNGPQNPAHSHSEHLNDSEPELCEPLHLLVSYTCVSFSNLSTVKSVRIFLSIKEGYNFSNISKCVSKWLNRGYTPEHMSLMRR